MLLPSTEKEIEFTPWHSPIVRDFAVCTFQMRILPSREQAARCWPFREKAMQLIREQFFPRRCICPVSIFHKRTVSSQLPEATYFPSGENATAVIRRSQ